MNTSDASSSSRNISFRRSGREDAQEDAIIVATEIKRSDLLGLINTTTEPKTTALEVLLMEKGDDFFQVARVMQSIWQTFACHPYPTAGQIANLGNRTGMAHHVITEWFQKTRVLFGISWNQERINKRRKWEKS